MDTERVIGIVTEFIEDRPVTARLDKSGNIIELVPGETKISLKLKLKNTVGEIREVLVDGPANLGEFFSAGHTREDMAKVLVGE